MKILFAAVVAVGVMPCSIVFAQQPSPTAPSETQSGGDMEPGVKGGTAAKAMGEMANHDKRMRRHHVMDRRHLHVKDKNPSKNQFQ